MSLLCCAVVAAMLGLFAAGGDRLGLWEPVNAAPPQASHHAAKAKKHHRAASTRRLTASPQAEAVPAPPVPARAAFLVAALAAALAGLIAVLQSRTLVRVLRNDIDAMTLSAVHVVRPPRAARVAALDRARLLRGVKGDLIAPLARHAADVGAKLLGPLRSSSTGSFDRLERVKSNAAQAAKSARAAARMAAAGTARGLWEARERWTLRRRGAAPYLISLALATALGWLVGAH